MSDNMVFTNVLNIIVMSNKKIQIKVVETWKKR